MMKGGKNVILLLLCAVIFMSSCDDTSDEWDVNTEKAINTFTEINESIIDKETFVYFTDPHLLGNGNLFNNAIKSRLASSFVPVGELF